MTQIITTQCPSLETCELLMKWCMIQIIGQLKKEHFENNGFPNFILEQKYKYDRKTCKTCSFRLNWVFKKAKLSKFMAKKMTMDFSRFTNINLHLRIKHILNTTIVYIKFSWCFDKIVNNGNVPCNLFRNQHTLRPYL